MNAFTFLVSTLFDLYITVVLLRVWLQWARADFYNPFSQFVVKMTQPVVAPLRRIIPSVGQLDMATLVFAYLLSVAKFFAVQMVDTGGFVFDVGYFIIGFFAMIKAFGNLLFWVMILRAILSWVSQGNSPIEYVMYQLSEPFLAPIRRFIPAIGGLDLSMLALFILLQFLNFLIGNMLQPYFGNLWYML